MIVENVKKYKSQFKPKSIILSLDLDKIGQLKNKEVASQIFNKIKTVLRRSKGVGINFVFYSNTLKNNDIKEISESVEQMLIMNDKNLSLLDDEYKLNDKKNRGYVRFNNEMLEIQIYNHNNDDYKSEKKNRLMARDPSVIETNFDIEKPQESPISSVESNISTKTSLESTKSTLETNIESPESNMEDVKTTEKYTVETSEIDVLDPSIFN